MKAADPYQALAATTGEYVELHLELSDSARPSDYPALLHINELARACENPIVFDLGGCVGNLYYCYRRYLSRPERFRWVVNDLPEMIEAGRRIAAERGEKLLTFADSMEKLSGCDLLLISGALHYFPYSLRSLLESVDDLPRHILINRSPLTEAPEAFTVQDANGFLSPCRLICRGALIKEIRGHGYELVDQWQAHELSLRIPLHPEHSASSYSGLYFRLPASASKEALAPGATSLQVVGEEVTVNGCRSSNFQVPRT